MAAPARSAPVLEGSDPAWGAAFDWACRQAAAYRYDDEPVGPCFEAALPGRRAFCVRDVCHQSTGAQVLGMAAHTKNMLRRFAESISDAKDWCPYWEITRDGAPAAADYRSDARFWYNLPGSFDLVEACHRQFLWTGDADYVDDPVFREFYRRTLGDFVGRWDRDDDGIPDHRPEDGHRGIATYNEQVPDPLVGGDLLGAMYGALRADAAMRDLSGDRAGALDVIPDEVVDDLVVHGSPEACRAHVARYVANGVTVPLLLVVPGRQELAASLHGLAPR